MGYDTAFLVNMITPYRLPLFSRLNERLAGKLDIYPFTEREIQREWKIDVPANLRVIWTSRLGLRVSIGGGDVVEYFLNPSILYRIVKKRYRTVIIAGYHNPTALLCFSLAKMLGIPVVLWSGTTFESEINKRSEFRNRVKRTVFRYATCVVVYGTGAGNFAEAHGAGKIFTAYNSVDNELFNQSWSMRRNTSANIKRVMSRGLRFLFVGQLIQRKGVLELLAAFAAAKTEFPHIFLSIVGNGPLCQTVINRAASIENVSYEGSLFGCDLLNAYAAADVLCLPSKNEVWGLVVNEAMCAGLAVIATKCAGCTEDLVEDGVTGIVVDSTCLLSDLTKALCAYARDPKLAVRHGEAGHRKIQSVTPEAASEAFYNAIMHAEQS